MKTYKCPHSLAYYRRRYATVEGKVFYALRSKMRRAFLGTLSRAATFELIGCSSEHLWRHLAQQFEPGMTWENYGTVWHIDHIVPCKFFDLTDSWDQQRCYHHTNLQPLFKQQNLSKGGRF